MKTCSLLIAGALALSACTSDYNVRPIPGSINYDGPPRSKLSKAPIGSTFTKQLLDEYGNPAIETYRVQPDRSLLLLRRERMRPDL